MSQNYYGPRRLEQVAPSFSYPVLVALREYQRRNHMSSFSEALRAIVNDARKVNADFSALITQYEMFDDEKLMGMWQDMQRPPRPPSLLE
jgi:hypothetical protein